MAQTDSLKKSPVRTMSNKDYQAWVNGVDLKNRSYVAELNHYPLPDKALKYKAELDLSPTQVSKLNAVIKTLKMKKAEIGESVIRNEKMLDSLFRTRKITDGNLIFFTNRYGLYEGEYRTALLQACYATGVLLTDKQIKKLESMPKQ